MLLEKGILYCPDFVINAGGVRSVPAPDESYDKKVAKERVSGIAKTLLEVLDLAEKENLPTNQAAEVLARRKIGL